jgi:hypothetical protein
MNTTALLNWAWGILHDAIEGFAHGAVLGTGLGSVEGQGGTPGLMHTVLVVGSLGALKQALLYLNTNGIPPLLLPKSPAPATPAA